MIWKLRFRLPQTEVDSCYMSSLALVRTLVDRCAGLLRASLLSGSSGRLVNEGLLMGGLVNEGLLRGCLIGLCHIILRPQCLNSDCAGRMRKHAEGPTH